MKKWVVMLAGLLLIPCAVFSQDWGALFLLDGKTGYSSNTYLNPVLSEWNRASDTGYGTITPMGNIFVSKGKFSSDLTGGGAYSMFTDEERDAWSSLFLLLNTNYRIADRWGLGVETGGSHYSTQIDRSIYWIQPVLSFSPSLFTRVNIKAGSSFRKINFEDGTESSGFERFNNYTVEFETWPTLRWQLRAGVFGDLNNPAESLGARASSNFNLSGNWNMNLGTGIERYRFQIMTDGGGGGGFPPGGNPGNQTATVDEADILYRASAGIRYRVNSSLEATVSADYLNYYSTATEESLSDIHASVGFRVTLFNSSRHTGGASVEVRQNTTQSILLNLNYDGEGQLYILGDFNDWDKPGIPLVKQRRNRYAAQLTLDTGAYEYKILLVEGDEEKWLDLSDDTFTISDGFGGENGLLIID